MSRAAFVPPTSGSAGSAVSALRETSVRELLHESLVRFRYADGLTYATAISFGVVLTLIPGLIFVVALAARIGPGGMQDLLREAITNLAPGPAGDILLTAFQQGSDAGRGTLIAVLAGGAAALTSGVSTSIQLQRGASRIYGILEDRPMARRYGLAIALTLSFGVLIATAFLVIVFGSSFVGALRSDIASIWSWARWPIGVVALTVGLGVLFKLAPNRLSPGYRWLAFGGATAGLGWLAVSGALTLYLTGSTTFGETYGPLAGFIGIMIWGRFSAVAIFYGMAVAAQLEARRAGVSHPTVVPVDNP